MAQLKALTGERETNINAEIDSLNQSLTPEKAAALKTFLIERFAQRISYLQPVPLNVAPTPPRAGRSAQRSTEP